MSDDGNGEFQVRGKQLVFYGMSVTVVAVVVFLCGVLVGRGVPSGRAVTPPAIVADETLAPSEEADTDVVQSPSTVTASPAPLEYPEIVGEGKVEEKPLRRADAPKEPFASSSATKTPARSPAPVVSTAVAKGPSAERPAAVAAAAVSRPASPPPTAARRAPSAATGNGRYLVQVAAYRRPAEAASIEARLKGKGYPVLVTPATTANGTVYRVRVGAYETEREAQTIADRLKKEEKLEPWVTR